MRRVTFLALFLAALAYAQFRLSGLAELTARLDLSTNLPARVYLFKDDRPFRLSPVDAMLPLRVDLFYRERLWKAGATVRTLEVTARDTSHFILLEGRGTYELPQGKYRVEAHRGLFYRPVIEEFELTAGQTREVRLKLEPVAPGRQEQWLAGDDHIHLVRAPEDDDVLLRWLDAEDLAVGNFLQLQRQMDAAAQYGFGPKAEARRAGYSIRSGQESRSHYFGHVNLLGGREIVRPLSVGAMYANSPGAYPFPWLLFQQGRRLGATVGFAHFDGSQPHSTLLMDLALGAIDFLEVFQFGVLKMEPWYELLNAGLRVSGIAGSDFPVPLNRAQAWPRTVPLLGPERTLVKAKPGASAYEAWADGVRGGNVVVSNGPLLELTVNGKPPGASIDWAGESATITAAAAAWSVRPIVRIEIVVNGKVAALGTGASLSARIGIDESSWIAARVRARAEEGEPEIWAHTNPVYVLRGSRPVLVKAAREELVGRWEKEMEYYRSPDVPFAAESERRELLTKAEEALAILRAPLSE